MQIDYDICVALPGQHYITLSFRRHGNLLERRQGLNPQQETEHDSKILNAKTVGGWLQG